MAICKECGTSVPDEIKFCTGCGKPMTAAAAAAAAAPLTAADGPPPKGSPYTAISTGGYVFRMILFSIPLVGWIFCVITAFGAKNINKRNFARAMLVFMLIGIVLSAIGYVSFGLIIPSVKG